MKAVEKPIEIEVEKFTGEKQHAHFTYNGEIYKVWNHLHNSWIEVKIGDYLNITSEDDVHPIDADYFSNNYNLI